MSHSFLKLTILLLSINLLPNKLLAIEGLWHPFQIKEGWQEWKSHHPNKSDFSTIAKASKSLVRVLPKCSGFFVSPKGHIITSYSCLLRTYEESSFNGLMDLEKGSSPHSLAEALWLSPLNAIYHQVDSYDISDEIAKKLAKTKPVGRLDKLNELSSELEQKCQEKRPKYQKCRVQSINSGTQYLMIIENELQGKLLFAPSISKAITSKYMGLGTNGLDEGELPVLVQVLDPSKTKESPYLSSHYFTLKSIETKAGDPVFSVSYSNIYKRYLERKGVEGNLIRSQGFLDIFEIFAQERQDKWEDYYRASPKMKAQNINDFLYGAQWNYRLGIRDDKNPKTKWYLEQDLLFRKEFHKFFREHASKEEQEHLYKVLNQPDMDKIPNTARLMKYLIKACSPTLIIENFKGSDTDNIHKEHILSLRARMLDHKASAICYHTALLGLDVAKDMLKKLSPNVLAVYNLDEKARIHKLTKMIGRSVIQDPNLHQIKYESKTAQEDELIAFYNNLMSDLESIRMSRGKLEPFFGGVAELIFYPYLEKYLQQKNKYYFPGMDKLNLQVYGFGDVKEIKKDEKGHMLRFASSIDSGFRNMRGSPTLDASGQLVGMFWSTDYEKRPLLNFYYDYDEAYGIHTSTSAIVKLLKSHLSSKDILKDLGI